MNSRPDIESMLEMEAFDEMPPELQAYVKNARTHLPAFDVLNVYRTYRSVERTIRHIEGDIDAAIHEEWRELGIKDYVRVPKGAGQS